MTTVITHREFLNRREAQGMLRRAGLNRENVARGHAMAWRLVVSGASSHQALHIVKRAFGLERSVLGGQAA
ncbi:hypothetical protein EO087_00025 [Dyella sp. M7H15-1]|uniref:hypothetical protein n=1 Tax=Dyella sp. M7H15-1 TaxID=2501295 RepID=UPI001004EE74|nr:hypothetical protein [Dyella sp. M7H15-1]QAU22556.1 hypothetical protein EO087_00025 [Dyella sp. M7H15-1]